MLDSIDFHYSLVCMPLIRIEVEGRHKLQTKVLEHGSKLLAPVADSGMRNLDIECYLEYQSDISKRVFTKIKHRKRCDDQMHRISHTLEISFSKQV